MPMAGEVRLHLSPDGQDLLPFPITEPHGSLKAGPECSPQPFVFPQRVAGELTRGIYSPCSQTYTCQSSAGRLALFQACLT